MSIFNGTADDIFNKKTDYPIGSICMFNTNIDPNEMYGGTWVRIKGKFILGADDNTYPLGSEGGETTHTHSLSDKGGANFRKYSTIFYQGRESSVAPMLADWQGYYWTTSGNSDNSATSIPNHMAGIGLYGSTDEKNILPPYVAFYIWAKVA